jgi:hypothetical protein
MSKTEDDLKPPEKKYAVVSVELKPKGVLGTYTKTDEALHAFAKDLEERMNYIKAAGWSIMHIHWVDERGVVLVCDSAPEPPQMPFGVIPMPSPVPMGEPEGEDASGEPELNPALARLINGFQAYAASVGVKRQTEREENELEQFMMKAMGLASTDTLLEFAENLEQVCVHHEKNCDRDSQSDCLAMHLYRLTQKKLRELAKSRLQ